MKKMMSIAMAMSLLTACSGSESRGPRAGNLQFFQNERVNDISGEGSINFSKFSKADSDFSSKKDCENAVNKTIKEKGAEALVSLLNDEVAESATSIAYDVSEICGQTVKSALRAYMVSCEGEADDYAYAVVRYGYSWTCDDLTPPAAESTDSETEN